MFTISTDPKDVEAGLAPEHYGDPNKSCQGNADDADDGTPKPTARGGLSSYPAQPAASLAGFGSARSRGWGPGWPTCTSRLSTIVGGDIRITVRSEIAELVQTLLNYADDKLGYNIKKGQTGGFNCRPVGGTTVASNHSWGLAIDINWQDNPYSRIFTCDMPPQLIAAFWKCGFYWGGWYRNRFDPMHFEYVGTPQTVSKHLMFAKQLLGGVAPAVEPVETFKPGSRVLESGMQGSDVQWLQQKLGIEADGFFGPMTRRAVMAFQRRNLLSVDGGAGPATFAQISKPVISLSALATAYKKRGSNSDPSLDTISLQKALTKRGHACEADGFFGRQTRKALMDFRSKTARIDARKADIAGPPAPFSLTRLGFAVMS